MITHITYNNNRKSEIDNKFAFTYTSHLNLIFHNKIVKYETYVNISDVLNIVRITNKGNLWDAHLFLGIND